MSTSNFNKMTIQELKDFAKEHKVPLEGAKLKSDIIKKLKNYKPEEDCGCNVEFTEVENENAMNTIQPTTELSYPPCFEICGYAKEIFDANRDTVAFSNPKFMEAMGYYSGIFCFEKDLRDGKISGYTSPEGMMNYLESTFSKTQELLTESMALEVEKNKEITKIHTKNIMELVEKNNSKL
jgi:hypothetical protein